MDRTAPRPTSFLWSGPGTVRPSAINFTSVRVAPDPSLEPANP